MEDGKANGNIEFATNLEEFNTRLEKRGDIKPNRVKMKWRCTLNPNHGIFETSYDSIKNSGSGCPKCSSTSSISYEDCVELAKSKKTIEFAMSPEEFNNTIEKAWENLTTPAKKNVPSLVKLKWKCKLNPSHGIFEATWEVIKVSYKCPKCRGITYKECVRLGESRDDLEFALTQAEFNKVMNERGDIRKARTKELKWRCKMNPNHGIWENSFESIRSGSVCPLCGQRLPLIGTYVHPLLEYYSLKILKSQGIRVKHEELTIENEDFHPDLLIWRDNVFRESFEPFQKIMSIPEEIKMIAVDFTYSLNSIAILEKCNRKYQSEIRLLIIVLLQERKTLNAPLFQDMINKDPNIFLPENIKVINYNDYLSFLNPKIDLNQEEVITKFLKARELGLKAIRSDEIFRKLQIKSEKYKKRLESY